jgi:asparagine synthase (glutamine-hydrolysing)
VRAPFGWLPCLIARSDGLTLIASDVELLAATGLYRPRVDLAATVRHLAAGDVRRGETCLAGLTELRGGDRWSSRDGVASLWSPWQIADQPFGLDDPAEARRRVRETVISCVAQRAPTSGPSLLLASGGLDSSVVAAALQAAGRRFTMATYVTANPAGDERRFVRQVSEHVGAPLVEQPCAGLSIDLLHSAACTLPRPVARAFEQETDRHARALAAAPSARAVVGGGGGDNLFCALQSPAPATDALLDPVGKAAFWTTSRSIADMTQASLATVARRAWWRARRPRRHGRALDLSYLSSTAAGLAIGALDHPWLTAPPHIPPGKAAHIALLVGAQGVVEDGDPPSRQAVRSVLIAQPLVETCLRIPSWLWFERGRNRAVARRAFENDLPPDIAWRRTKGSPDSLLIAIFERERETIRSMLLDGVMASHGLLDIMQLRTVIDDPRPAKDASFARVMQLVDVEAWLRCWPH